MSAALVGAARETMRETAKEPILPESRHKYLYERLGDHDFQLLVNALLTERFPDYLPLPLRQAEGGRDGLRRSGGTPLVYQVKWSGRGHERDPVAWLSGAARKEEANIRRLVAEGVAKYVLVTNVPSTGKPRSGTFDRIAAELDKYGNDLGIEMTALWRESVDAMVDSSPDSIKWAYADMLAGWDLIRYLIDAEEAGRRDNGLRDLVRKVARAQWHEDERVKFSQVDIDRERITDLFVDVTAERVSVPSTLRDAHAALAPVGGAAAYLLGSKLPFTLVRGAPGQGKSTLSQYLCQAHRAAYVPDAATGGLPPVARGRFPIRFDLGPYAAWTRGIDVFDPAADTTKGGGRQRPAAKSTIECFIAELMTHASGGTSMAPEDVQELFERLPALVVIDGLDEVGSLASRRRVVAAIDRFCARSKGYAVPPQIVVTTRPSAGELPEPAAELFEVLTLNPLDKEQRGEYLRRWCAVNGIRGRDGRDLRANFKTKSAEPYIGELAGNPMQLTILLELLHKQGAATPTQRTELYDEYMGLLLAREANKHPDSVRKHRRDLLEIIPFLGWYLQSRSEEHGLSGRMAAEELAAAMRHFQATYAKPESVVDELFDAATDRLWALTSKEQGAYEFEVVSLREYFAARFLYGFAGEGDRHFDSTAVLAELLRRPYWLNTARFYAGNATGSDIYVVAGGIRDLLSSGASPQVHIAAWTLVTDGVFVSRPTEAAAMINALCSDTGAPILLDALHRKDISPLPALPSPTADDPTWVRLTGAIASSPASPDNAQRARVLRELLSQRTQFGRWWANYTAASIGTPDERPWLELAAGCEAGAGVELDLTGADLADGGAELILNSGIVPPREGRLEADLIAAVLDGQCPGTLSTRSLPAQIAVALAPAAYRTNSDTAFNGIDEYGTLRRQAAVNLLRRADSPFADIAALRRFWRGERGSTFPWANTATALHNHLGPCWLANEIAVIGAASKHKNGWTKVRGADPFGPQGHPTALMTGVRDHAGDIDWWRAGRVMATDDLSRAVWALALWALATRPVCEREAIEWARVVDELSARRARALRLAARGLQHRGVAGDASVRAHAASLLALPPAPTSGMSAPALRPVRKPESPEPESLASIARRAKWFKVDAAAIYR